MKDPYEKMLCPICEVGTLTLKMKELIFEYHGVHDILRDMPVYECVICGEGIMHSWVEMGIDVRLSRSRCRVDIEEALREAK